MNRETLAAIDIGSNAIRLLVNYIDKSNDRGVKFKRAAFIRVPIRLGEDVFTQGEIGAEKREKLSQAMMSFAHLMNTFNVKSYRACATSAMREAGNGAEVVDYIKRESGINIEIINGKEEAQIIFQAGDMAGLMEKDDCYVYVDVGGGSTEVTIYSNHKRVDSESFRLGTVRTISEGINKDEYKRFKEWLRDVAMPYAPSTIIGSGGNINKVHKLLSKKEEEAIHYVELKLLYDQIESMTYEERIKNMGLNTYRADVIPTAMRIFLTVSKCCKINDVLVPKVGLADGIIHELYRSSKSKK